MLLGKKSKIDLKKVAVLTRNPAVTTLLGAILEDWGFVALTTPDQAAVTFVERGLEAPASSGRLVWLTPMPLNEGAYLEIPISLTRLYHMLEEEFFPSPRRHIRVSMNCPADLQVDGAWEETTLISMSDRGGRLRAKRELPRGSKVSVEVKLAGRVLRLPGEILYCIPAGDLPGRENPQVGILFKPLEESICSALRMYIEQTCVDRACSEHGLQCTEQVLSWIELQRNPWSGLEDCS